MYISYLGGMNMKSIVGERGQIVIPKQIREKLGLARGTILEVETSGDNKLIVLKPMKKKRKDWREWIGTFEGEGLVRGYLEEKKREKEKESKWQK
jgi:AbrB family looped-hinge helix DNA binding protein